MKKTCPWLLAGMVVAGTWFAAPLAQAGPTLKMDETKWVSVGAGLRASFSAVEDAAPGGDTYSKEWEVENIRLYLNGQIHKNIKLEFNTERDTDSGVRILDVVAKFEFTDLFNVWIGRFLPPSDRSNLDGPFYLNTFDFPFVQAYPAIFAGRDDGAAVWGQVNGGTFKYQIGLFQGRDGGPNTSDNPLIAGRLTVNFWDPEPGYYNSSTYYGAKEVLAVGLVGMYQKDGAGTAQAPGNFTGWSIDLLMEKKLAGGGVVSLEGAYYSYDLDDRADASLTQGESYFVLASYLFPGKVALGQLQPQVRYQRFDRDVGGTRKRTELGLNYIIDGHNARVSFILFTEDPGAGLDDANGLKLGVQLQI